VPDVLLQQLAKGGELIAPFDAGDGQVLMRMGKDGSQERLAIAHPLAPLLEGASRAL